MKLHNLVKKFSFTLILLFSFNAPTKPTSENFLVMPSQEVLVKETVRIGGAVIFLSWLTILCVRSVKRSFFDPQPEQNQK